VSRQTIQQFRADLAGHAAASPMVHASREIARRPDLATGVRFGDWPIWSNPDGGTATAPARRTSRPARGRTTSGPGIHQFRAAITDGAGSAATIRGYRELARRPERVARMQLGDWVPWDGNLGRMNA